MESQSQLEIAEMSVDGERQFVQDNTLVNTLDLEAGKVFIVCPVCMISTIIAYLLWITSFLHACCPSRSVVTL